VRAKAAIPLRARSRVRRPKHAFIGAPADRREGRRASFPMIADSLTDSRRQARRGAACLRDRIGASSPGEERFIRPISIRGRATLAVAWRLVR